jgi:GAF domain-containing protein
MKRCSRSRVRSPCTVILEAFLRELAEHLHKVVKSDYVALALHDEKHGVMHWHTLQAPQGVESQLRVESPVDESPSGWVWQHQETLLLPDLEQDTRPYFEVLHQQGIRSICLLPLTTAQCRLGVLGFGSTVALPKILLGESSCQTCASSGSNRGLSGLFIGPKN